MVMICGIPFVPCPALGKDMLLFISPQLVHHIRSIFCRCAVCKAFEREWDEGHAVLVKNAGPVEE